MNVDELHKKTTPIWSWLSEFIMYVLVGLLRSMPRQELWCKVFIWNVKETLSGDLVNEIGKRWHQ